MLDIDDEIDVDTGRQSSFSVSNFKTSERTVLVHQTLKERIFGPYYGSQISATYSKIKIGSIGWCSDRLLFNREIEEEPTRFVGVCRKLFRRNKRWN